MTHGLTIPGVATVHPREDWNKSGYSIDGPVQAPTAIWRPVIHYSAAINVPDGDLGEFEQQIGPWLTAVQRDYEVNRGYSVGYLWAVDWLGGVWELRGFDFAPAANAGHNYYTAPILFITDRDDPGSEWMWQSARAVWREHRRRANDRPDFENRPRGHGELRELTGVGTPTACPGAALIAQRNTGLGDLDYDSGDVMPAPSPLVQGPQRAYDTRPGEKLDPPYDEQDANGDLPRTKIAPGQPRKVFVGLASTAEVHVTVVNPAGPGHVEISNSSNPPRTSLANYSPASPVPAFSTGEVALDAGHVWVHTFVSAADVIVDVRGLG